MEVKATNYVTLANNSAGYSDDEKYISPNIIGLILFDALKIKNVEEFVNEANITVTEEEIKEFLSKKFEEENPELKKRMEAPRKSSSMIKLGLGKDSIERIKSSSQRFMDELEAAKYYFEPYSLQYFKIYTSILKEKLQTLFSVLNDIKKCKSEKLSEEEEARLLDLDFHINAQGNIYYKDADRLAAAIIYNVNDLREKIQKGNNPETYLTFKESKHNLMKDGIFESEIYPSKKIQIKDSRYGNLPGFIALSEEQEAQVEKEEIENFTRWMNEDFEQEEKELEEKGAVLQKVPEDN